jgi:hypothetical protein
VQIFIKIDYIYNASTVDIWLLSPNHFSQNELGDLSTNANQQHIFLPSQLKYFEATYTTLRIRCNFIFCQLNARLNHSKNNKQINQSQCFTNV